MRRGNAKKLRRWTRTLPKEKILAITVPIMIVAVAVIGALNIHLIPAFNLVLLAGLIAVTTIYAYSTLRIARYTKEQAEELKEQRLSEARPYLLLRLADEFVQWDKIEPDKHPSSEFKVTIRNAGKGPAINLEASLWHSTKVHPSEHKGYLAPNEEWEATIHRISIGIGDMTWLPELKEHIRYDAPGVVAVKYQDIHKRNWVSYLCLERHVDIEAFVTEGEQNIVELQQNDPRRH